MFEVLPETDEMDEQRQKEQQKKQAILNDLKKQLIEEGEDEDDEDLDQKIANLAKQKGIDLALLEEDWRFFFKHVF